MLFDEQCRLSPGIYFYKTDRIKIKFVDKPKKPWCIDGEKLETIDMKYDIRIDNSLKIFSHPQKRNVIAVDHRNEHEKK